MVPKPVPAGCREPSAVDLLADSRRLCLHSAGRPCCRVARTWHPPGNTCIPRAAAESTPSCSWAWHTYRAQTQCGGLGRGTVPGRNQHPQTLPKGCWCQLRLCDLSCAKPWGAMPTAPCKTPHKGSAVQRGGEKQQTQRHSSSAQAAANQGCQKKIMPL